MLRQYFNHLRDEMSPTGRRTFPWHLALGAAEGAIFALYSTFALLVAIDYFDANTVQKSFIASSLGVGLILSMVYASWAPLLGRNTIQGALPSIGTCTGLILAANAKSAFSYTLGSSLANICMVLAVPIMTGIYRYNYRDSVRGQVVGVAVLVTVTMTLFMNSIGAGFLSLAIENYRFIYLVLAVLALVAGFSIYRMPAKREFQAPTPNPFACFSAIRENPLFGYIVGAWFLFGFANLALLPQRFEYLTQPQYGFRLGPGTVILIVGVTTEGTRILLIQFWARLFDRFNFVSLLVAHNLILITHFLIFYNTPSLWGVTMGAVLYGIMFSGTSIFWNLWVTKLAPPQETAKYMAVHTFSAGVRGIVAPFLGYWVAEQYGLHVTSWICAGMVSVSMIIFWFLRPLVRVQKRYEDEEPVPEIHGPSVE